MSNLLRNANLLNWYHVRYFTDKTGNTGTIEHPLEWEFVVHPKHHDDPEKLPQSLHRDHLGFVIAAGWRMWEAGYRQGNLPVQGGKRYRVVANFVPQVGFAGKPADLTAITWRWLVAGNGLQIEEDWQMTRHSSYGQQESHEYVFDVPQDMVIHVAFMARSVWAGNTCDLAIANFVLEEVAQHYGGATVAVLGQSAVTAAPVTASPAVTVTVPQPVTQPATQPVTSGGSGVINTPPVAPVGQPASSGVINTPPVAPVGQPASSGVINTSAPASLPSTTTGTIEPSGLALGDVLGGEDIDEIIAALNAMSEVTQNPTIINGFRKLAAALEKIK